jgi:SAM-dependent methyltransferase
MSKSGFDDLTDIYEAMIDWPKRLANEEPFYRHWFEKAVVENVVDVACGTGRHATMFHGWGLKVEGADLSQAMIARSRANFGESERLHWVVRGFDQPIELIPPSGATAGLSSSAGIIAGQASSGTLLSPSFNIKSFDAAVCMGNSLTLAPDVETVQNAIRRMFAAVRPGGIVMIQVLNLWQLPDGPCVWQKCKLAKLSENAENEVLILKGVHRCGSGGYVDFLVVAPADGKLLHHESVPFLGLEASQLEQFARTAGAKTMHFFGDYRQHPYKPEKSTDLILVAEKN